MRTKIIALINSCSQYKSGGDMVFIEIAKRLKGYDLAIVTPSIGKTLCQNSGLKRGKYLITTREQNPEFDKVIPLYAKRILKGFSLNLKARKGDVFLGTSDFLTDVLPILWYRFKSKQTKWVQHIFHLIPSERQIPYWSQRLSLFFIKHWADRVVVDNHFLQDDLVKTGFKLEKIIINHPGIDLACLQSVKGSKKKDYDVVFMAQLRPSKGIFDLIKIWRLVDRKTPRLRLGIIGRGKKEHVTAMKQLVKKFHLEKKISFLGYLPDDQAYQTIKSSRLFISSSFEEGFGISLLEAQALGLPVVAWHLPVFNEVFSKGMIKVKIGDLDKFSHEVIRLLTDECYYQSLARDARENAAGFSWEKTAKREEKIFISLMK